MRKKVALAAATLVGLMALPVQAVTAEAITLTNVVVTSSQSLERRDFADEVFYVARGNRSAGFKIRNLAAPFAGWVDRGDIARIEGILQVESGSGEACVVTFGEITVSPFGKGDIRPLIMKTTDLGGRPVHEGSPDERPGVTRPAPHGPYNKGLLVSITGKVTQVNHFNRFFYVDDGCGLDDGYGPLGVRVSCDYQDLSLGQIPVALPDIGDFVAITGISSSEVWQGEIIRLVKVRDANDIRIIRPWPMNTDADRGVPAAFAAGCRRAFR
ncbi:MAG: hypothetical protein KatS3mg024_0693 [Armatimonadota bacterium]|nr:MAG: hypothetical protein KatS3mg024_0693 [Armatimonadota bacterium]